MDINSENQVLFTIFPRNLPFFAFFLVFAMLLVPSQKKSTLYSG